MTSESMKPAILLVEDQPDDIVLMRLALRSAGVSNPLFPVGDGLGAISYLSGFGQYCDRDKYPIPGLILLDIKMPVLDGFGVLAWLQEQPQYDKIAVVMLSSSGLELDIERARALGADDYLVKPNHHHDLVRMVKEVSTRWLEETKAPNDLATPAPLPHAKASGVRGGQSKKGSSDTDASRSVA